MKFDYIVIGGGLCGLMAGIRLAESGKKTAIVSSGQSALHFCAGSFGLLGKVDGKDVSDPLEAIDTLPENHPYRLAGKENVRKIAAEAKTLLANAGINVSGSADKNHYTLTPFGMKRPSWLTFEGYTAFDSPEEIPFKECTIIAIKGFLEGYPSFIADNLEKQGVKCHIETIDLARLERLRKSNFDMRAVSVAKQMDKETIEEFASKINSVAKKDSSVLIPAVIGIYNDEQRKYLCELVKNPVYCIPTIPVSVAGMRAQHSLQRYFEKLGGTYLLGDHVDKGIIENGKVKEVITTNFGDDHLTAKGYILAGGFLFSEGIMSNPKGFYEPVFGLDVHFAEKRDEWYDRNFFATQPYMSFGVEVDKNFHPMIDGKPVENLYAAGAILAHCNTLKEDSGAGEAIVTGIHVADLNLKN
ncbi:MAG: anaerobic glycerol-3-phosphate dehydrogenase subunit B [Muribaculaceae bacterium]|nr:anaerobic glycerol-3-phosphate dehydrogenase subunit B [Muribaculaceae bacterium]